MTLWGLLFFLLFLLWQKRAQNTKELIRVKTKCVLSISSAKEGDPIKRREKQSKNFLKM